ncbi:MAG: rhodanese-like domain-containing protein [Chloroflexota bacterium]|nr:rhodanese-like domain-containing protein [Dehalococcoidia bacterium]MDW8254481.1 rhodanese-like domain-containing protein [Chloroflexota bacterium]
MGLFDWLRRTRSSPAAASPRTPPVQDIGPAEAQALQAQGALIIDVRSQVEYETYRIPGARLIPIAQLRRDLSLLPESEVLVFVCEMGGRSATAAALAAAAGRTGVYNLAGGMQAWLAAGLPVETSSA